MNVINEQIRHSVFGEGKIIGQEADRISVQFSEKYGTKKFLYPEVFADHLELENSDTAKHMLKELRDKETKVKAEKILKKEQHEEAVKALEIE